METQRRSTFSKANNTVTVYGLILLYQGYQPAVVKYSYIKQKEELSRSRMQICGIKTKEKIQQVSAVNNNTALTVSWLNVKVS